MRRSVGEHIKSEHLEQTVKLPPNQMFWCYFTSTGILVPVKGMLNFIEYIQILQNKREPFMQTFANGTGVFQLDLSLCRNSKTVQNFVINKELEGLDRPGNAPHVYPIEKLWSILEKVSTPWTAQPKER